MPKNFNIKIYSEDKIDIQENLNYQTNNITYSHDVPDPKCDCKSMYSIKKHIVRLPKILFFYSENTKNGSIEKDTNKYLKYNDKLQLQGEGYDLYGVLVHLGPTTKYGHYIAYVKSKVNNKWYKTNDSCVEEVDLKKVLNQKEALGLFYKKADISK